MRGLLRGLEANEIGVVVRGCRSESEGLETGHLVLSALLLLSYGIRRGLYVRLYIDTDGACFEFTVDSSRVRGLSADYYAGVGLLRAALRRGRIPGIKAGLHRGPCPTVSAPVAVNDAWLSARILRLILGHGKEALIEIPCKPSYAFLLAVPLIALEAGEGVKIGGRG